MSQYRKLGNVSANTKLILIKRSGFCSAHHACKERTAMNFVTR